MTRLHFCALMFSMVFAAPPQRPNIIWLQTDSMDGRLLDSTSDYFYKIYLEGIKSHLIPNGVNFVRHYTASPQCVPSRTSMVTGRYVHETDTSNNGQGLARSPKTGSLDTACVAQWNEAICSTFAARQNQSYNALNLLDGAGYDMQLFARFDIGANLITEYPKFDPTGDGFHGGPTLPILARGAGIRGTTKSDPWNTTSETDSDPYAGDQAVGAKVSDFLTNHDPTSEKPFFLWMGLIAPHPDYHTNATFIRHVNASSIDAPAGVCLPDRATMHNHDIDMSILKNCFAVDYTEKQLLEMRTAYWG